MITHDAGAFRYVVDGATLAELTYSRTPSGALVILDHTEVSPTLKGQGVGKRLVEAAVAWARQDHLKILPLCPFARSVFDRTPDFADVLDES